MFLDGSKAFCHKEPKEPCVSFTVILIMWACFSFLAGLNNTFSSFGPLTVEWPGKDGKHPRCPPKGNMPKGKAAVGHFIFSPEHHGGGGGDLKWAR